MPEKMFDLKERQTLINLARNAIGGKTGAQTRPG